MNTKKRGLFRFVVFQEKDDFVGVCLDLNIVEYGTDPISLAESVKEAAFSYLESVRTKNLSDEYLNKPAPDKYWKKLFQIQKTAFGKDINSKSSLLKVNTTGACFFNSMLHPYGRHMQNC